MSEKVSTLTLRLTAEEAAQLLLHQGLFLLFFLFDVLLK